MHSTASKTSGWFLLASVAGVCLLATLLLHVRTSVLMPDNPIWNGPYDHHKYLHLAEAPIGSFHINPTSWRLGVPLLVRALPGTTIQGFQWVGFAAIALTGFLMFYFLRDAVELSATEAWLGLALYFSYGHATKHLLGNPYNPDAVSLLLTLLALYFLYKKQDIRMAIALLLGAFVKETVILVFPLIYTLRAKQLIDIPLAIRTVILCLPAIVLILTLRIAIPAWNEDPEYVAAIGPNLSTVQLGTSSHDYLDALQRVTAWRFSEQSMLEMVRELTWGSGGILWVLPFFALRKNAELLLRYLPMLGLSYYGFLMALNFDRRLAACFPVLILMGLAAFREISAGWKVPVAWFIPVVGFLYLLNLLQPLTNQVPFDIAAGAFFILMGILYSLGRWHRADPPLQPS